MLYGLDDTTDCRRCCAQLWDHDDLAVYLQGSGDDLALGDRRLVAVLIGKGVGIALRNKSCFSFANDAVCRQSATLEILCIEDDHIARLDIT
ncbi:MAG: hypothetical protein PPP58_00325 [Natronomonas sp.]